MTTTELIAALKRCPRDAEVIAVVRGIIATKLPSHAPLVFKPQMRVEEGGIPMPIEVVTAVENDGQFIVLSSEPFELT